jgi:hypothetical protein
LSEQLRAKADDNRQYAARNYSQAQDGFHGGLPKEALKGFNSP